MFVKQVTGMRSRAAFPLRLLTCAFPSRLPVSSSSSARYPRPSCFTLPWPLPPPSPPLQRANSTTTSSSSSSDIAPTKTPPGASSEGSNGVNSITASNNGSSAVTTRAGTTRPMPSLEKQLIDTIKMNGPIPLALYMKQCLTSATHGYYTTAPRDPFGPMGDFITSPELTQLFGEMLALWILTEWLGQGRVQSGVVLMELGPGKGTLMADVLRTLRSFPDMQRAVSKVVLVEASPRLRKAQRDLLCGNCDNNVVEEELENGWKARAKEELGGMEIQWYEDWDLVPRDTTTSPFILAHEFFDALPIHAFQSTPQGWRELLVSHRPRGTPSSTNSSSPEKQNDVFHLTLSQKNTPYSLYLPTLSPRHRALLTRSSTAPAHQATIEISPQALSTVESLSHLIASSPAGACLIIDYGPSDHTPTSTLRGIHNHHLVSPFTLPGQVDLSADVDFLSLAERAVTTEEGIEVHGPVEQGPFLETMGLAERVKMVLSKMEQRGEHKEERGRVVGAFERLVGMEKGGMGRIYKALAVVKERGGRRPVGFGGGVVQG